MEINIWSDIRCPFCYIGKRKFEAALKEFSNAKDVKVTWKSFELDPTLQTQPNINLVEHLAMTKGMPVEQAKGMVSHVMNMASEEGLKFNFDHAVVASSYNAHRLLHFAKSQQKGDQLKEALLKAHLEDGINIDDIHALTEIAVANGLEKEATEKVLNSDDFGYDVKQDEMEAQNIGVRGVPFFVFDNKYAISGAQPTEAFLETLNKAWGEFASEKPKLIVSKGDSCDVDGNCD
jgi:predicted DsbA family dithiol-disulfide isomerase